MLIRLVFVLEPTLPPLEPLEPLTTKHYQETTRAPYAEGNVRLKKFLSKWALSHFIFVKLRRTLIRKVVNFEVRNII
jgi:hypothetical protein